MLKTGDALGSVLYDGNGSPEGVQVGKVGDLYLRLDGGAGTSLYVKESGVGNTGWTAMVTATGVEDHKVLSTAADILADYLFDKVTGSGNINATTFDSGGGNVKVDFAVAVSPTFTDVNVNGDVKAASGSYFYAGSPTVDGSWRWFISGTDLVYERREGGSWIQKGAIAA
jgi:sporulation protein YlmC with PRC-barrel domain